MNAAFTTEVIDNILEKGGKQALDQQRAIEQVPSAGPSLETNDFHYGSDTSEGGSPDEIELEKQVEEKRSDDDSSHVKSRSTFLENEKTKFKSTKAPACR